MIRISGIRLELDENENDLTEKIGRKYNLKNIRGTVISKKSVDARKKSDIHYVYAVDLHADNEAETAKKYAEVRVMEEKPYVFPCAVKTDKPIVIVGAGPAGLMCALTLAQNGGNVVLLERGKH